MKTWAGGLRTGPRLFHRRRTAVLQGWRESTIDVDIKLIPHRDEELCVIPALKESLRLNIELAAQA